MPDNTRLPSTWKFQVSEYATNQALPLVVILEGARFKDNVALDSANRTDASQPSDMGALLR
jgi:hypothetical protein